MSSVLERGHPRHPLDRDAYDWWATEFGVTGSGIRHPKRSKKRLRMDRADDGRIVVRLHVSRSKGSHVRTVRLTTLATEFGWKPSVDVSSFVQIRHSPSDSFGPSAKVRIDIARQAFAANRGVGVVIDAKTDAQREYVRLFRAYLSALPGTTAYTGFTITARMVTEITDWTEGSSWSCIRWLRDNGFIVKVKRVATPRTFLAVEEGTTVKTAIVYRLIAPVVLVSVNPAGELLLRDSSAPYIKKQGWKPLGVVFGTHSVAAMLAHGPPGGLKLSEMPTGTVVLGIQKAKHSLMGDIMLSGGRS